MGHTHEDIDARWAKLWRAFRKETLFTPVAYKRLIETVFSKKKLPAEVFDIFAVPDYTEWLKSFIDPDFKWFSSLSLSLSLSLSYIYIIYFSLTHSQYYLIIFFHLFYSWTKREQTQHQWKCEAVPVSVEFPLGVKTLYRAFAQDEVIEIVDAVPPYKSDAGKYLGIEAVCTEVKYLPKANPEKGRTEDGMYLLYGLPINQLMPMPFIHGSRETLEKVARSVKKSVAKNPVIIDEWDIFLSEAPLTDNVLDYVRDHPLHIPLHNFFLEEHRNKLTILKSEVRPAKASATMRENVRKLRAGESVSWSLATTLEPPRVAIDQISETFDKTDILASHSRALEKLTIVRIQQILKQRSVPYSGMKKEALLTKLTGSDRVGVYMRYQTQVVVCFCCLLKMLVVVVVFVVFVGRFYCFFLVVVC